MVPLSDEVKPENLLTKRLLASGEKNYHFEDNQQTPLNSCRRRGSDEVGPVDCGFALPMSNRDSDRDIYTDIYIGL